MHPTAKTAPIPETAVAGPVCRYHLGAGWSVYCAVDFRKGAPVPDEVAVLDGE